MRFFLKIFSQIAVFWFLFSSQSFAIEVKGDVDADSFRGKRATTQFLQAGDSIDPTTGAIIPICGSSDGLACNAAVNLTSNPQITAGTKPGESIVVEGTDDTNTVTLETGTGLSLQDSYVIGDGDRLQLWWDGATWGDNQLVELVARKDSIGGYAGRDANGLIAQDAVPPDHLHDSGAGAPSAGSVNRDGHFFIDTSNNALYFGADGAGSNFIDVASLGDAYTEHNDGTNATSASGPSAFRWGGTDGIEFTTWEGTGTFTNQPSNDGIEVLSSAAGDTTQTVTVWGTTTGTKTVVSEDVALNGTTAVATTKTDWGLILALELDNTAAGTVTAREASGDQTITTIAAGDTKAATIDQVIAEVSASGGVAPAIQPYSKVPVTGGMVYYKVYNSEEELLHVTTASLLTSDAIARLRFQVPQSLPSGVVKVRVVARANATSGNGTFDPKWCSAAVEEAACTVQSEGTSTITWEAGDTHQRKEAKIALDADTVVAGEIIEMDFTFIDVSHTLTVESAWHVSLIWE